MAHKALQGVNLDGWLMLESWVTPELFAKTSTASWSEKPNGNGVALQGFKGIGTTGMSFVDVNTVTQK